MQIARSERLNSAGCCSSSGRPAAEGRCAGSKKSFYEAQRKREVLYLPLLTVRGQEQEPACADAGQTRRNILQAGGAAALLLAIEALPSQAVSMPQAFDNAWSAMGGGPADLSFPEEFMGHWLAESTLTKVETPLGPDFVPNLQVVERAKREDLQQKIRYEVAYIKNKKGKVIIDRRFNTSSLMNVYMGRGSIDEDAVMWNPNDPNRLSVQLPGGVNIVTRVVRRSEEMQGKDRINTSEFFEQVFQTPGRVEPRVKASQCFTKYKWRSQDEAARTGGPMIVATQVVSDYLTPYDGEGVMLRAQNRPVVVYTYTMAFRRPQRSRELEA